VNHVKYLLEALACAKERRGFCAPNPAVGAVLVKNEQILSRGCHHAAGYPHAEVVACENFPHLNNIEGVTLYVTLEPCSHWGKTPPCTEYIVSRGIKNVVYAFCDPNPNVQGKGEYFLKQNRIDCKQVHVPEIEAFYQSYAHWVYTHKPWVTCKLAMTLDAKIAGAAGRPIRITGEAAKEYTHLSRLRSDAILTTARTIQMDDPHLNVRLKEKVIPKPLYLLDSKLSLPLEAKVFNTAEKITVFYSHANAHKISVLSKKGVICRQVVEDPMGLSLKQVIKTIGEEGVHDLWVETGGKAFSSFVRQGVVNKSIIYIAPKLLGPAAYPVFWENIDIFKNKEKAHWFNLGEDMVCEISW
jgi:diaminohydroxyphosphoribosylaminopyrimidine deaminase/5-amino-6-(5-phosphoribosylamino)uracil reductase